MSVYRAATRGPISRVTTPEPVVMVRAPMGTSHHDTGSTALLARLTADAAGGADRHRTRHIDLGSGVVDALPVWLQREHPDAVDVVIADPQTWSAAGERVEARLRDIGRTVRHLILEPRHGDPHLVCEDGVIESLRTFLDVNASFNAVAVGAGTVNDVVKAATHELDRGYQVVPTAASMNGYTSSIVAVLSGGVKHTKPTHQAEAVFADIDIVRQAPAIMNQAGFGDLVSKPYSNADWLLSHLVRGVEFSDEAATLLDAPWNAMVDGAAGIGRGERDAIEILLETILISGFSMAIAGTSAPASGGEHLVSHYWDMEQHCQHVPIRALHGTQVGIGTLMSALVIDRLVALPASAIDPVAAATRLGDGSWIDTIDGDHPHLTADVLASVKDALRVKQSHGAQLIEELTSVRDRWDDIRARLATVLIPPARVWRALIEAGCPRRASDLGVDVADAVRTLRVCRHIRNRYVGLDLASDLGLLDQWAPEIIALTEAGAPA